MKKILIIGNGFDLNLGRKSSYEEFYDSELCPKDKDYPAPLIKYLNGTFGPNLKDVRWLDLENEFEHYYKAEIKENGITDYSEEEKHVIDYISEKKQINVSDDFTSKHSKIIHSLIIRKVLSENNGIIKLVHEDFKLHKYERDKKAFELIKKGLLNYFSGIEKDDIIEDSLAVKVIKEFLNPTDKNSNIYSFNYTKIKINNKSDDIPNNIVKYVHGSCLNNNIILGTRDGYFDKNYAFLQKSFDTKYAPPQFISNLMEADDITFFGHSLGYSDRQYFENFFKQITSHPDSKQRNITIFTKNLKSEIDIKYSLQEMTERKLSFLISTCNLKIIKTDDYNKEELADYFKRLRRKSNKGIRRIN